VGGTGSPPQDWLSGDSQSWKRPRWFRGVRTGVVAAAREGVGYRRRLLLTRRARSASGTATQCTRRNDSPPPPEKPRAPPTAAPRRTVRGSARAVRAAPGQRRESTPAVRHLDSSAFQLRHENTRRHREIPVDGPHRSGKEEETSRAGGQFPARATARWAAPLHRTAHWLVGMGSQNCRIVGKSQPFLMIINAPPSHILAPRTRPPHPRSGWGRC
jgi:hypothetical protein